MRQVQLVILAFLVVAVAYLFVTRHEHESGIRSDEQSRSRIPVAGLPCDITSNDPRVQQWAEVLHRDVLHGLSYFPELAVKGAIATEKFKGYDGDIRKLGEELKVSFVLECVVDQANTHFTVAAKLTRVANGSTEWADLYEVSMDSYEEVPWEISKSVASALNVSLPQHN